MPQNISAAASERRDLDPARILRQLGVDADNSASFLKSLPFALDDTTAGSETELQAVVIGRREDVDLPITIEESNYFANIERRAAAGEMPQRLLTASCGGVIPWRKILRTNDVTCPQAGLDLTGGNRKIYRRSEGGRQCAAYRPDTVLSLPQSASRG